MGLLQAIATTIASGEGDSAPVIPSVIKDMLQNPLQKAVSSWLLRTVANYEIKHIARVASVIGTARGRIRTENQDKAVAAVFEASVPRFDFYAFVVCDGLGGMQDGGRCAASAASYFLTHLVSTQAATDRARRLRQALAYANQSLVAEFHERGGTTLSAVLITHSGVTAISVGDTRIYKHPHRGELKQLTVDDTIAGRVAALAIERGGSEPDISERSREWSPFGHHLAQFVGQSAPLQAQVLGFDLLSAGSFGDGRNGLLITTDGVHRLGRDTFSALVKSASSAKEVVQHLIQVADWTGGVDNATAMWVSIQQPSRPLHAAATARLRSLQLFDAYGDFFSTDAQLDAALAYAYPLPQDSVSPLDDPSVMPVERERIRTVSERDVLPLIPREQRAMHIPEKKSDPRSSRRKRPVKASSLGKSGKKKKKDQRRRGRSQRQDDEGTQPELDIKVTQHTE